MLGLLKIGAKTGAKAVKSYKKLKKAQEKQRKKTEKENAKNRPRQDYAKKKPKKSSRKGGKLNAALLAGTTAIAANEIHKQNKKLDEKYKKKRGK